MVETATAWELDNLSKFSCPVVSDSLRLHGLWHTKLPCLSPTPRACSDSCPLSWWCHSTISSSVVPFFSCLQSFPASGSFPTSRFFASGGQSVGASASATVLPMNIQDWFPLGLTFFDPFAVQGTLKHLLQHHSSKASVLWCSAFFMVQPSHPYMTTGKTIAFTRWTSVSKVMSLLFNFLLCFHSNSLWKFVSYRQEASKKPHCQPHKWERALPSKADKEARMGWRARTPPRRTSPLCLKYRSSS